MVYRWFSIQRLPSPIVHFRYFTLYYGPMKTPMVFFLPLYQGTPLVLTAFLTFLSQYSGRFFAPLSLTPFPRCKPHSTWWIVSYVSLYSHFGCFVGKSDEKLHLARQWELFYEHLVSIRAIFWNFRRLHSNAFSLLFYPQFRKWTFNRILFASGSGVELHFPLPPRIEHIMQKGNRKVFLVGYWQKNSLNIFIKWKNMKLILNLGRLVTWFIACLVWKKVVKIFY